MTGTCGPLPAHDLGSDFVVSRWITLISFETVLVKQVAPGVDSAWQGPTPTLTRRSRASRGVDHGEVPETEFADTPSAHRPDSPRSCGALPTGMLASLVPSAPSTATDPSGRLGTQTLPAGPGGHGPPPAPLVATTPLSAVSMTVSHPRLSSPRDPSSLSETASAEGSGRRTVAPDAAFRSVHTATRSFDVVDQIHPADVATSECAADPSPSTARLGGEDPSGSNAARGRRRRRRVRPDTRSRAR